MTIYTIGFTKKDAEVFFSKIKENDIQILIDVRLNNQSQLAGFTKERDLAYFLKNICGCEYSHEVVFAPTKKILDDYKKGEINWDEYEKLFLTLVSDRHIEKRFKEKYSKYDRVLLLCSEPTPENCHRRLVAEYLKTMDGYEIIHI